MKALVFIAIVFSCCKTAKVVQEVKTQYDSTAMHQRDSLSIEIKKQSEVHKRELEQVKNTGVTFQKNCDTIIIDKNCNYDSALKVIRSLKNAVKINRDGSIEAVGKLSGVYSNFKEKSSQFDSLNASYALLQQVHQDSLVELKKSRQEYVLNKKSKPAGILSALTWLLIIASFLIGSFLGYKFKHLKFFNGNKETR